MNIDAKKLLAYCVEQEQRAVDIKTREYNVLHAYANELARNIETAVFSQSSKTMPRRRRFHLPAHISDKYGALEFHESLRCRLGDLFTEKGFDVHFETKLAGPEWFRNGEPEILHYMTVSWERATG